jgi:hypothetical protein
MSRPLLITDCDEVLLHMVAPFAEWIDEAHDIHFDLDFANFGESLRHKATGELVPGEQIWPMLRGFFATEMHRQMPIKGAIEAVNHIAETADVIVLTNLTDDENAARRAQLKQVGLDFPVITNQGGKGEALARILDQFGPSSAVFVDDLVHQHDSVAQHAPDVWRLHMVGEPRLANRIPAAKAAHARIDDWDSAKIWILSRFADTPEGGVELEQS